MCPLLLRPEPRFFGSSNAAKGAPLCTPGVTTLTTARRPAEVGLTLINAMVFSPLLTGREVDVLTRLQGDIRFLPVVTTTRDTTGALDLALDVQHLHTRNFHLEQAGDSRADFLFGRVGQHTKNNLIQLVGNTRALFGDHGRENDFEQTLLTDRTHYTISSNCLTAALDRKSTRLNSSHQKISYAV